MSATHKAHEGNTSSNFLKHLNLLKEFMPNNLLGLSIMRLIGKMTYILKNNVENV